MSDLGMRRLTPCVKRPSKQRVAAELADGDRADVKTDLTVFSLAAVIPYSSGYSNPCTLRLF